MQKIGVKYCGGCNPRYNRRGALEEIKEELKDLPLEITHAKYEEVYDYLIVLGGCTNCCASYEEYKVRGKVLKLREEADKYQVIDIIKGEIYGLEEAL